MHITSHSGVFHDLILVTKFVEASELDGRGCLVQVGNGIELEAVGLQFEP